MDRADKPVSTDSGKIGITVRRRGGLASRLAADRQTERAARATWPKTMPTTIEWTDETWNPMTGCTHVSPGCRFCYAEAAAPRTFKGRPFTEPRLHRERLDQPLRMRKRRRIFVNSMSDLFHERFEDTEIDAVFAVMLTARAIGRRHVFQILTKRAERMRDYTTDPETMGRIVSATRHRKVVPAVRRDRS